MQHFYRNVPGLGTVAVSRYAQAHLEDDDVSDPRPIAVRC